MNYIIILLCILLIPLINMNTKETFVDINCNNKNDILGSNTDYIDNKFHPDKYIKIDNQLNFNTDNTKNTLDPKISFIVFTIFSSFFMKSKNSYFL